LELALKEGRE
jgi:hypothetical protein